jgi:hypothetical protein
MYPYTMATTEARQRHEVGRLGHRRQGQWRWHHQGVSPSSQLDAHNRGTRPHSHLGTRHRADLDPASASMGAHHQAEDLHLHCRRVGIVVGRPQHRTTTDTRRRHGRHKVGEGGYPPWIKSPQQPTSRRLCLTMSPDGDEGRRTVVPGSSDLPVPPRVRETQG